MAIGVLLLTKTVSSLMQPLNVFSPKLVKLPGNVTEDKFAQLSNAPEERSSPLSMLFKFSGRTMLFKLLHSSNVPELIVSRLLGSEMDFKFLQLPNAIIPM